VFNQRKTNMLGFTAALRLVGLSDFLQYILSF